MMFDGNKKDELHRVQKYLKRDIFPPLGSYHIKRSCKMYKYSFYKLHSILEAQLMLDILIRISFISVQDYIKKISNKIPIIFYHPKVSPYFHTLLISDSRFKITTIPQIAL